MRFALLVCTLVITGAFAVALPGNIAPELADALATADSDELVSCLVHMRADYPFETASAMTVQDRIAAFRAIAAESQAPVLAWLGQMPDEAEVRQEFWVMNGFHLRATPRVLTALARRPDIAWIAENSEVSIAAVGDPVPTTHDLDALEWNIQKVMADKCWDDGYTGEGVIIGLTDSGVDHTHPALAGKWSGHWFVADGFRQESEPYDDNGHGTHCMGTILGYDGIGVAPNAKFAAAKVLGRQGGSLDQCIQGLQFMADIRESVDVRVVSNSWGTNQGSNSSMMPVNRTLLALGILPVFANGNSGPNPGSVGAPGSYPMVVGVGATNSEDNITEFSSRGPAPNQPPWDDPDEWFRPDWNLIKPNISAPGADIKSCLPDNSYAIWSGTSMACPHIVGVVALMLQKNPYLTAHEMYDLLLDYSDQPGAGEPYPNNDFGWGRLNAWRSLRYTPVVGHDVALKQVLVPESRIDEQLSPRPSLVVRNRGSHDESVIPVHCRVDSLGTEIYRQTRTIGLAQGEIDTVVFPEWRIGPRGNSYDLKFWHSVPSDTNRHNDTISMVVTTRHHDIRTLATNLSGRLGSRAVMKPLVTLRNADHIERDFNVWLEVDSAGTRVYFDSLQVDSVPALGMRIFEFEQRFEVGEPGQFYEARAWHDCPTDEKPENDTLRSSFTARDKLRIMWLYADFAVPDTGLTAPLMAPGDSLEFLNVRQSIPALSRISPYHVVGVHSNFVFHDPTALGNVLADYVDAGGGVVIGNFGFSADERGLAGRIMTGEYATIDRGRNTQQATTLDWFNEEHAIMFGVNAVGEFYAASGSFNDAAEPVASWQDGRPYVAVSGNRRVVGVNSYPGPHNHASRTGDWALVFVNALHYVADPASGVKEFDPFRPVLHVTLDAAPSVARRSVTVSYAVPSGQEFNLAIFDITGRLVRTLARGGSAAGAQRVGWDVSDEDGRRVASGVYFCRLTTGDRTETRKLIIE